MKNEEKEIVVGETVVENEAQEAVLKNEEKTFGMLCHLLGFAGVIGIPFGNILGPLIMWLVKKNESSFVDQCGKESLNFQISLTIYAVVCALLTIILIGFAGLFAILIIDIICIIKASIKANNGKTYTYPLTIRFIK